MQKLLLAAALVAAGFWAVGEFSGPGGSGFRFSAGGGSGGGVSKYSNAPRRAIGGTVGAAARLGN